MPRDPERERIVARISTVALTLFGLYLIVVPLLIPSFGWNAIVEKFGETRVLTLLVGFLFLYFSALAREKDRLRLVTGEIVEGLNRAIHGADVKSQRDAVGMLIEGLKSDNAKVRAISLRQLRRLTGADPGDDHAAWTAWWRENGDKFTPARTSVGAGAVDAEGRP
jgi:hypothetical protein